MIYLDHNATTPVAPEVLAAMLPWLREQFGNASSLHRLGRQARAAVEQARASVARLLGARPEEILFTSGGSESNNMVLQSVLHRGDGKRHIVTSRIEHPSVLETCKTLERRGARVTYVPVDRTGRVDPDAVRGAITDETAVVSLMHANNEVGTVQLVAAVGRLCRERGVFFHTDAVQTAGCLSVDIKTLSVDLLSLSAHKCYGPKGVGALYVRKDVSLRPLMLGGHQEQGRRAGTEHVAGIVGLGCAAELAAAGRTARATHASVLRNRLWEGMRAIDGLTRNGHSTDTLPGTLSICVDGVDGESLVLALDGEGVCCSTGSACSSGRMMPSHVLLAMGVEPSRAAGAVRFSVGSGNTADEIDHVVALLPVLIKRLRAIASASAGESAKLGERA